MSLMDTIKGAREEVAAQNTSSDAAKRDDSSTQTNASSSSSSQGFTRRSAARSKPAREAAAGVRVVTKTGKPKKKAGLTKEEQKAERAREREVDDRRYSVREMMLENDPEFKRVNKVWHRLLIVGAVFVFIALTLYGLVKNAGDEGSPVMAAAALGTMLFAYVIMGIALIYNWRMVRPLRVDYDHRVASMSDKKLKATLERGSTKK